jgi:hypothetical protein
MVTDTRRHLTWEQVRDALGAMAGSRVTVRVVERSDPEMLVAVFEGNIGVLSQAKHPALFWPVGPSDRQKPADAADADLHAQHKGFHAESPGFYLHRDRFLGGEGRAGHNVLVIAQGPVLINIRQS